MHLFTINSKFLAYFWDLKGAEKGAEMRTTDRSPGVLVHERDLENICLLSSMWKSRTAPRSASAERHQGKTGLEWIHAK